MQDSCSRWRHSSRRHSPLSPPRDGTALAAKREIQAISAQNAAAASLRTIVGLVNAVLRIKADSAPSAANQSPQGCPSINVINAAGSRKILHILLSSVRSAAIPLMTTTEYNTYSAEYIYRIQYSRYLYDICCTELL